MNRINKTPNNHKYIKNKNEKFITFKKKICFDNGLFVETTS